MKPLKVWQMYWDSSWAVWHSDRVVRIGKHLGVAGQPMIIWSRSMYRSDIRDGGVEAQAVSLSGTEVAQIT